MTLCIYGSEGAGIEIYDLALRCNQKDNKYSRIVFIDDFQEEGSYYGTRRIHFESVKNDCNNKESEFIIAVGEPTNRKLLYDRVKAAGYSVAKLIDPCSLISQTACISEGCIINAGAVISSNVMLHENCLIMFYAIVGHDATVNKHCVVCPKASVGGNSIIGDTSFIGLGSSMKQNVNIGNNAIVGLGSVVFRDVDDNTTVLGNPARVTKGNNEHKVFS